MNFNEELKKRILVFDGAFGTMLQKRCNPGHLPELLNVTNPDIITEIHKEYVLAGADIITANTFGANSAKAGERSAELITAGVELAKKVAGDRLVALDLGPTGRLMQPVGDMSFEECYKVYAEAVKAGSNADIALIETMSDLAELRSAIFAVRENSNLPVIACMTFAEGGRTFTGTSAECFALTVSPLVDAIGVNCSLGPKELLPIVRKLVTLTDKPIIVQANAGLPDAEMRYSVSAEEFAYYAREFIDCGVRIIGGCCGTTPEYTAKLRKLADTNAPRPSPFKPYSGVCSATRFVNVDGVRVIGERINPTGKKAMKKALLENDLGYIDNQALEQSDGGADILDVNAGLPELDEVSTLTMLIKHLQRVTDLPLQIDTTNPVALESALRAYHGKAIVNSVSGEAKSINAVLPLVKKYGSAVVALTVDEKGVPKTVAERLRIA